MLKLKHCYKTCLFTPAIPINGFKVFFTRFALTTIRIITFPRSPAGILSNCDFLPSAASYSFTYESSPPFTSSVAV